MAWTARRWWLIGAVTVILAAALVVGFLALRPKTAGPGVSPPASSSAPGAVASPSPSTTATPPPSASPVTPSSVPSSPAQSSAAASPSEAGSSVAQATLAAMSVEQRVGQVLMVSSPVTGADANSLYALDTLYVGNVFMKGRSEAGQTGIADVVSAIKGHVSGDRTQGVRPFVATDQEGGLVQIMRGPGFAEIPQAIEQGQLDVPTLTADATLWGQQLAAVGVNVNLAPVMDTVPSPDFAPQNAPIGAFGREFAFTPQMVSSHGVAFAQGMAAAGVAATVKHFPGLGRVTGNTDVTAGVTDTLTGRNDPYVAPFRDAVKAGVPWLMISNAFYPKIDANDLAPFSSVIVHDMVRGDLGFTGIIVSDDICDAVQVAAVPVEQRGVDFIDAGGTMALCTNQALVPQMYAGMVSAAQSDPAFADRIDAAALLILQKKAEAGLID